MIPLHPFTLKILLAPSSVDSIDIPTNIVISCNEFSQQKSNVNVKNPSLPKYESTVFLYGGHHRPSYHTPLSWELPLGLPRLPRNIYSVMLVKPSPLSSSGEKESMVLHLKADKGIDWTDKELNNILTQAIIIFNSIDEMIHNLYKNAYLIEFFFEKKTPYGTLA